MLDAKDTQFRLAEDGVISFQVLDSNPLPGEPIAKLVKGGSPLMPEIKITDAKGVDEAALQTRLQSWFDAHLKTVLEPLMALRDAGEAKEPVRDISQRVYDAMGIVPRESLEETIAKLDEEDRKELRARKIRLGPILVFIPALNKPAAVRLRALLWSLYHDAPVPANVPNDGIVSCVVDPNAANKDFYQSIGYPVFADRAIRIDMLDRVICAVYDGADKGKFQAQHQMAEWLGSTIDGLYGVLEAMGHNRISEDQNVRISDDQNLGNTEETEQEEKTDVKPDLAWFYLKRGKAFEQGKGASKPFKKQKPADNKSKNDKKKGKRNKDANRSPRVMSAEAKANPEDNPFAVLEQLKK